MRPVGRIRGSISERSGRARALVAHRITVFDGDLIRFVRPNLVWNSATETLGFDVENQAVRALRKF